MFSILARIGPVTNVLAMQLAKKRIEMIKMKHEEKLAGRTVAQTTKTTGRVAHSATRINEVKLGIQFYIFSYL